MKRKIFFIGLIVGTLILILSSNQLPGEEASAVRTSESISGIAARAELQPELLRLTDEPVMTIAIEHSTEYQVNFPQFGEKYGDFEVLETVPTESVINNGIQTSRFRIRLRPEKSGDLEMPPIPVTLSGSDPMKTVSLLIPSGKVHVASNYETREADPNRIQEAFGELHRLSLTRIIGIFAAIVFVLLLFYFLLRRQKKSEETEAVVSPQERALAELELLMQEKVYVRDVREFYLKITGIVRWFIEQTTGLRAPEQTTEEFLGTLARDKKNGSIFSKEMKEHLKKFLEFSDLVKFARFHPTLDDIFTAHTNAKHVIETPMSAPNSEDLSMETSLSSRSAALNSSGRLDLDTVQGGEK